MKAAILLLLALSSSGAILQSIPVNVAPNAQFANVNIHARQTRFSLDFRSPTEFGEDLRVYFEGDFYGPNGGSDPRLRHYYGQLKNFLLSRIANYSDTSAC